MERREPSRLSIARQSRRAQDVHDPVDTLRRAAAEEMARVYGSVVREWHNTTVDVQQLLRRSA